MYQRVYHTKNLSELTFLVTGGAGFIGSNLVEYLLKNNVKKVIILDNFSTGNKKNIEEFLKESNCELIEGDIRDLDTCKNAMISVDYVLHQAALGSVPRSINNPITSNEVNISGFLNMLVAAEKSKTVKRVVYAASSSTYGDHPDLPKVEEKIGKPLSPYAVTKYVNELYADVFYKTYGLETIGLRYFNVFGPKQNPDGAYAAVIPKFISHFLNNKDVIINGDGKHSRDFTFVENAVQANIKALFSEKEVKGKIINIACGGRVTINELFISIRDTVGNDVQAIYREDRPGDVKDSLADISLAQDLIGYNPEFGIDDGLAITTEWFKKEFLN